MGAQHDPDRLPSAEEQQRLSDRRDTAAGSRDLAAEARDRSAEARDRNAEVRDDRVSAEQDPEGVRQKAGHDRRAAARDRSAADEDRQHARTDRDASRRDLSVAQQVETRLLEALNDTDDLAESILLLGQAQGLLMDALAGDAAAALIELEQRAARAGIGLQEAARQIVAEHRTDATAADRHAGAG